MNLETNGRRWFCFFTKTTCKPSAVFDDVFVTMSPKAINHESGWFKHGYSVNGARRTLACARCFISYYGRDVLGHGVWISGTDSYSIYNTI